MLKLILLRPGLFTNLPTDQHEEPDACFVPNRLLTPNPALNPCDRNVCFINIIIRYGKYGFHCEFVNF